MTPSRFRQAFDLRANLRSIWHRPSERFAAVDGLRALSMLWVVLAHVCLAISRGMPYDAYVRTMVRVPWLFSWVLHGEKALDTFFVISGFLIGGMLLAEHRKAGHLRLGRFFARRYLRLMPAYGVGLLLLWAMHLEGPEKSRFIWANILYVNNFLPQRHMFMDWSWSLAVEEQFYVVLPFFLVGVFFPTRRKLASLAVLFALSFVVRALVLSCHPAISSVNFGEHFIADAPHFSSEYFDAMYVNLYTRFGPFVLGVFLAWISVSHEATVRALMDRYPRLGDTLLALGTLTMIAVVAVPAFDQQRMMRPIARWLFVWGHRNVWSLGLAAVMGALLFSRTTLNQIASKLLGLRVWFPIAQLSYCAYLFHLGFVRPGLEIALHDSHPGMPFDDALPLVGGRELLVCYAITMALSFFFGGLVYLLVERPFLNLRPG
ncbi:MAG TPA: acyltransferase [Polyangiaceae bacterium]|jgi:peptidoglycan/LPS O-acetylase OafA/YrhL